MKIPKRMKTVRSDALLRKPIHEKPNIFYVPEIRRIPLVPERAPFTPKAAGKLFHTDFWIYGDQEYYVSNGIVPYAQNSPHLILTDSRRVPRFVLGFKKEKVPPGEKERVRITAIQRVRNEYIPHDSRKSETRWSKALEAKRGKELEQELGAKPSEVLLTEFIYQHRQQIKNGLTVTLVVSPENKLVYMPLVDRFFKIVKRGNDGVIYCELNLARLRVRKIVSG